MHFTDFVNNARIKQNPFGTCGFSCINMRRDAYVSSMLKDTRPITRVGG
jgi:hypothetical protein